MNKKRHKGIEGKARTLLNMLSDPGVIIDQHGIFLVVNDAFEKTTGLNPKELVGKPFLDLGITDAETKALLFENLGKVLRGIPVVPYEVQFVSGTGEKRFVEVKGKRITYVGQPADLVVFHDVTQRKENARKLREYAEKMEALVEKKIGEIKESEKKLRSITNSAFDAVFLFDEDDVIVYWNPAAEKIFGYSPKEIVGKQVNATLVPPRFHKEHLQHLKLAEEIVSAEEKSANGQIWELPALRKDGTEFPMELSLAPVQLNNKKHLVAIVRDITERKKAEETLHMSEEKVRGIFEASPDPIAVSSLDGKVLDCNTAALKTFGYSAKREVIGRSVFEFFAEKERARAIETLSRGQEEVRNEEYIFQTKAGREFIGELCISPVSQLSREATYFVSTIRDITERKKTEEIVKNAEERYRQLFNTMPSGVAVYKAVDNGEDFVFVDFNQTAEKIEKTPKKGILGKRVTEVFSGVKEIGLFEVFQRVFRTGQSEYLPGKIYQDKHVVGWRENWVYKLPDGNIVAVYNDVTDKKKAEEALWLSEKSYRALINGMNDTAWVIDLDAKFVDVNDAAVKVLGYSREELLRMGPTDIDSTLSREQIKYLVTHMPADQIQIFETSHTTKDGRKIPVEISSSLVTYQGKQAILSIARDITERKKAEEDLRVSEERFRAISNSVRDAIILVNDEGVIEYWNPAAEMVFGYTREEAMGKKVHDIVVPSSMCHEGIAAIKSGMEQFAKTGTGNFINGTVELVGRRKDGAEFPAHLSLVPIKLGDKWHAVGVTKDITEQKQKEQLSRDYSEKLEKAIAARTSELQMVQASLLKLERLAAIGELAGMVGHDLRNPLTGIKNAAYYLRVKQSEGMDETSKKMLEIIDNAITHADKIIGDLQEYSREMHVELVNCSPRAVLKEALAVVPIPKRVKLIDDALDTPLFKADETKMARVFVNIIRNAVDAMPEGGTLQVKSVQKGKNVEISFADTGIGMPEETLRKLFSPLVTTKAQGMGFGLAICKRIVDAHQGRITVKSVEGRGSTFTVVLPLEPKLNGDEVSWAKLSESLLSTTMKT